MRTHWLVLNDRVLSWRVRCCDNFLQRARGLICAPQVQRQWIWRLQPCNAVHTLFLAAPIDVVFCNFTGEVLRIVAPLPVRRWAGQGSASSAWEFPAGITQQLHLRRGDRLGLCDNS
jgi:uncharacterized membrane protein (UPF0127 family)